MNDRYGAFMSMTGASATPLAIVLAAGEGTRMRSSLPKVLHALAGRSMLGHVLAAVTQSGVKDVAVVVGPDHEAVAAEASTHVPEAQVFMQYERLGTGHAVLQARAAIEQAKGPIIVLFGDTPLVTADTITRLIEAVHAGAGVVALGFHADDPTGYGRLLTRDGALIAIREHKDASEAERGTKLCNAGLMALSGAHALGLLEAIGNANAQKEYYLTDVVEIATAKGLRCTVINAPEAEVMGINDRVQLARGENLIQHCLREVAMRGGATLINPASVHFSFDTVLGRDVLIEPHVVFGRGVKVADGAVIHSFSHIEGAEVGAKASVGPFARLRPGTRMEAGARIGNFVEIKNATLGEGAKVNHLTYIGDADVGAKANIGAGTITCNYDGYFKYRTAIGAGAFVGSNSSLVAPVKIGAGAYVGSGSVVTRDVAEGALTVARAQQVEKPGWAARFHATMAARKAAKKL
jgi:bifunctional UDP-N-acetylglucosamine pyrophosphorylase / glucosamine-1-phosphate N-acetyltransferase